MTSASRLSSVVRLFDLRLPSNRFMAGAFFAALVGAFVIRLIQGFGFDEAMAVGTQVSFSVFLSWAIARELDPDSPRSAGVAAVGGAMISLTGEPQLWAVTALLFAVRVVVRTTGRPPNVFDLAWLPALAAQSARSEGGFIAGLALAAALIWDAKLPYPAGKRALFSGAIATVATGAVAAVAGTAAPDVHLPTAAQWTVTAAAVVALPALQTPSPTSRGDFTGQRISGRRLSCGRLLAVSTGACTVLWLGGHAVPALVGLWAAIIGIAVNHRMLGGRGAPRGSRTVPPKAVRP